MMLCKCLKSKCSVKEVFLKGKVYDLEYLHYAEPQVLFWMDDGTAEYIPPTKYEPEATFEPVEDDQQ